AGTVTLCGKDISHASVKKRSQAGLSHIPEDRHKHGLVLDDTLENNIVLQRFHSMAVYAFATLLTWSHYGAISCEYLFGSRITPYYNILFLIVIVLGCVTKLEVIWNIADTLNCLLAIPNLIALVLLSGKVINIYKASH
ncbi:MAG: alanine:cation symporter family protein, partial [Lachnospiraceae bacterium]|nr:alanine:cation symporter family protein [Lachnospiraceae bacterium]